MASKVIFQGPVGEKEKPEIALVAGLEWRVLSANTEAALRDMGHERSATHATRMQGHDATNTTRDVGGFFVSIDGAAPPGNAHALAAAFAGWMAHHPNALLCYALSEADRVRLPVPLGDSTWLVVVVIAGSPVVDAVVSNGDEANGLIASYLVSHPDISIVSNDAIRYPQTVKAENILPALVHYAFTTGGTTTRLRSIPADARKLLVVAVLLASVVVGYGYFQKKQNEAARQQAMLERREKDPSVLYAAALRLQAPRLGLARDQLIHTLDAVTRLPLAINGWQLKGVLCESTCNALYLRQFGTTAELATAMAALGPGYTLIPAAPTETDLDKATIAIPGLVDPAGPEPLAPSHQDFIQGAAANQLQRWKTAGFSVRLQPPQLWPQVPGVPSGYKDQNTLGVGALEIGGIALPLLKEVLSTAPANVLWKGITMDVTTDSSTDNPLDRAKVRATGVFYIKN